MKPDLPLHGQSALATGASPGIGRAVAERLAMAGAEIVVHFHREREAAEALAAQWKGRAIQADLASLGSIEAMFAELTQAGCRLDMLVNNAGIWKPSPLGDTAPSRLHELVDVNLKGPFWVMQCALPLLAEGARVVNISSVAARIGVAGGRSLYGATKAAVEALTRNWALELAPRGILVNAVAPGYIVTNMTAAHLADPAIYRRPSNAIPSGAWARPKTWRGRWNSFAPVKPGSSLGR